MLKNTRIWGEIMNFGKFIGKTIAFFLFTLILVAFPQRAEASNLAKWCPIGGNVNTSPLLSSDINGLSQGAYYTPFAVNSKGIPYVGYTQSNTSYIMKFNPSSKMWECVTSLPNTLTADIVIDSNDNLYVAYASNDGLLGVKCFNENNYIINSRILQTNTNAQLVKMVKDTANNLHIACILNTGTKNITLYKVASTSLSSLQVVGSIGNGINPSNFILTLDSYQNPLIAYLDESLTKFYVSRIQNSTSVMLFQQNGYPYSLTSDIQGNSYIAYQDIANVESVKIDRISPVGTRNNLTSIPYNNVIESGFYFDYTNITTSNNGILYLASSNNNLNMNIITKAPFVKKFDQQTGNFTPIAPGLAPIQEYATSTRTYNTEIKFSSDNAPYIVCSELQGNGTTNLKVYRYYTEKISITYDGNGQTSGVPPVDTQLYDVGTLVTPPGPNTLKKINYSFKGWLPNKNGIGIPYTSGIPLMMNNITLYATWAYTGQIIALSATNGYASSDQSSYLYGTTATLTASPKEGYTFDGWYDAENKLVSKNSTFKIVVVDHLNLRANFVPIPDVALSLRIEGTGSVDGWANDTFKMCRLGTLVSLNATDNTDNPFICWKDSAGNLISTAKTLNYFVIRNELLTAVFGSKNIESHLVTFRDGYGNIIKSEYVINGNNVEFPSPKAMYGYDFSHWNKTPEEVNASTTDIVVYAIYIKRVETLNIEVNGGSGGGTYNVKDPVTITANTPEAGKKFSHWKDANNNIISYNETYKFYATTNEVLTAIFVNSSDEIVQTVNITITSATVTGEKISFVVERNVPSNYTLVAHGIILTNNSSLGSSEVSFNLEAPGIVKGTAKTTAYTGTYVYNKKAAENETWYARGYVVYRDSNNNLFTVYSGIVSKIRN